MGILYLLHESASGYALFERVKSDSIGSKLNDVQEAVTDLKTFSEIVKLKAFIPFLSAESALENINAISEGEMTPFLHDFLEMNVPKGKVKIGVVDPKVGNSIQSSTLGIDCKSDDICLELIRGCRLHFVRFIKAMKEADFAQAQLGLSHSYSRCKVKFNVHRVDNMVIQSICLLDQLDKDLNTFAMRVKEWYSWHFPELVQVVPDNYMFARVAFFVGNKSDLTDASVPGIEAIVGDEEKAQQVLNAARMSMGTDISPIDLINVQMFATRVIKLAEYRTQLYEYLCSKMDACAPNLTALIGEQVGARLISHAGSLTNLAKYPASTVQILGAEKALFRALKTKGNTPKYGLIFHSSFIGRAATKNKGRISRYLANKCSIASRIDSFSDVPTKIWGQKLAAQVEERLEFYKTGATPRKNIDVMNECAALVPSAEDADAADTVASTPLDDATDDTSSKKKKSKKDKKKKRKEPEPSTEEADESEQPKKKKAKKSKKKSKK